jgi:hypothetical protein
MDLPSKESRDFSGTPSASLTETAKPTLSSSPTIYQPVSQSEFRAHFKLYIGHVGQGSNAALDRNFMNAADFPDLARMTNAFLNVRITSVVPGTNTPGVLLFLTPGADHTGVFRAAAAIRPTQGSTPASFQNTVARGGSALASVGSNATILTNQVSESWMHIVPGTSDLLKGPVVAEILPRFDFRFEGNAGASVDVYACLDLHMWGQGFAYTQ